MEKKLFAEYLVEKGLIQEDQLASVLVEQIKALPSPAEIIHQGKLMKSAVLIKVVKHQKERESGFVDAAKNLGFWTKEINDEFTSQLTRSRRPISTLLIEKGILTLEQIVSAFDDYLSNIELESPQPPSNTSATPADRDLKVAPAESGEFGAEANAALTRLSKALPTGPISDEEVWSLRQILQTMLEGLRPELKADFNILLLAFVELLDAWRKKGTPGLDSDLAGRLKIVVDGTLELVWAAEKFYRTHAGEKYLGDVGISKKLETVIGTAQVLCFDIDINLVGAP